MLAWPSILHAMEQKQLTRLAKPFPKAWIESKPGGFAASYVKHHSYAQKLLAVLGPYTYRVTQIVRSADGVIEGCLSELVVTIDGKEVVIQEAGDCEQPGNWKTEGARLKDASSDAFKRCCMRLGLGLHLWAGESYVLFQQLSKQEASNASSEADHDDHPEPEGS